MADARAIVSKLISAKLSPFLANARRAVNLYELAKETPQEKPVRDDILRSAVVLLHASVEEMLRSVAGWYLPKCGEDALNRIPLADSLDPLRAEKFFLGKLLSHRGKTVDDLISESIHRHVERRTFSDTTEIVGLFETVGFEVDDELKKILPEIGALISRRHQVVHRADIPPRSATPNKMLAEDVARWTDATHSLITWVTTQSVVRDTIEELEKRGATFKNRTS